MAIDNLDKITDEDVELILQQIDSGTFEVKTSGSENDNDDNNDVYNTYKDLFIQNPKIVAYDQLNNLLNKTTYDNNNKLIEKIDNCLFKKCVLLGHGQKYEPKYICDENYDVTYDDSHYINEFKKLISKFYFKIDHNKKMQIFCNIFAEYINKYNPIVLSNEFKKYVIENIKNKILLNKFLIVFQLN